MVPQIIFFFVFFGRISKAEIRYNPSVGTGTESYLMRNKMPRLLEQKEQKQEQGREFSFSTTSQSIGLAVSVLGLAKLDISLRSRFVGLVDTDHNSIIILGDDIAVPFTCDLLLAAIACDVLKLHDVANYLNKDSLSWNKADLLTIIEGEEVVSLNPWVFGSNKARPLPVRKVD